jgi:nucleoside-diphosphate-sugar epimerase
MKVLFIGGTGIISSACSQLAVERGINLYLLNRRISTRPFPASAHVLHADIRNPESAQAALRGLEFDVVVDWVAFTPEHVDADIALFRECTQQYVFISSASAYQTPPSSLPVTESTLVDNPYWDYSRAKIACEERLIHAYRQEKFPMTIVRPSHTYDKTLNPIHGGYTMIDRMRKGKKVIIHGDGTSIWVLTHHKDFAKGFVGLLGNSNATGEIFHITSDEWLNWNQIYAIMARAAGAEMKAVHVPSDLIAAYDPEWGASLLGDKANSMLFDNAKIKRIVPDFKATTPFSRGAEEIMAWYDGDPQRQAVDERLDQTIDRIISAYKKAWPPEA